MRVCLRAQEPIDPPTPSAGRLRRRQWRSPRYGLRPSLDSRPSASRYTAETVGMLEKPSKIFIGFPTFLLVFQAFYWFSKNSIGFSNISSVSPPPLSGPSPGHARLDRNSFGLGRRPSRPLHRADYERQRLLLRGPIPPPPPILKV